MAFVVGSWFGLPSVLRHAVLYVHRVCALPSLALSNFPQLWLQVKGHAGADRNLRSSSTHTPTDAAFRPGKGMLLVVLLWLMGFIALGQTWARDAAQVYASAAVSVLSLGIPCSLEFFERLGRCWGTYGLPVAQCSNAMIHAERSTQ